MKSFRCNFKFHLSKLTKIVKVERLRLRTVFGSCYLKASFIDMDDDSWRFFLLFEKSGRTGECHYAVAGYLTVYQYYAYGREVNMKRPRISQMLILPRYQRQGLGSQLLDTVYRWAWPSQ